MQCDFVDLTTRRCNLFPYTWIWAGLVIWFGQQDEADIHCVSSCLLSLYLGFMPSCHVNKPLLSFQRKKDYMENGPVSPIKAILEQPIAH